MSDVPSTNDFASLFSDIPPFRHSNSDASDLTAFTSAPPTPLPSHEPLKDLIIVPPSSLSPLSLNAPSGQPLPATPKTPGAVSFGPSTPRSRRLTKVKPTPEQPRSRSRSRSFTGSPRSPVFPFEAEAPITREVLQEAARLEVFDEAGEALPFGDLFLGRKTVICFIRHFWCPLCQDYMFSISRGVDPLALRRSGVDLVIISNGSPKMIKSYRELFQCPFPLYTDPSRKLYQALGMTLRTLEAGPNSEKPDYVQHGSVGGMMMVLKHAMKMPLGNAGDIKQLGGEFCLGPGLHCDYAHRMTTTRSHAPIQTVLDASGVDLNKDQREQLEATEVRDPSMQMTAEEEAEWTSKRQEALNAIDERKRRRRVVIAQREKQRVLLAAALGNHWSCVETDAVTEFAIKAETRRSVETVASCHKGVAI
ncbi:hypothetical protein CALCODRAFT_440019 [Calocera cornea HHB12733]|uniref:AhpC-TSA-domain-containing protein n=1 Tax=Calocera cornea HHB12733 TaxID=1353952 RepID=A0A165DTG8_9BASI|nr:hypothetical protein CALCODRAFT_440019 [Calocera cornea HHB12733]